MTYAVFGDSYVTRLQKYIGKLDFVHDCKFSVVPGMSIRNKFDNMFNRLINYKPRYVFLNLGGNDINSTTNPDAVFHDIMYVVNELYRYGVKRVFVASILARGKFPIWTGLSIKTFTVMRRSINKRELGAYFIEVGKRLMFPRHYDKDLVHPGKVSRYLTLTF